MILEAIEEMLVRDYKGPTDIQSITWPVALSGLDLISIAKTGSGKTLGFILPGIVHTISQGKRINNEGPSVLVMLPTRELAKQVEEVAIPYCRKMGLKTVCLYGGVSKLPQSQALDRGNTIFESLYIYYMYIHLRR
jgi:superfamily II DNA/RNA helicase